MLNYPPAIESIPEKINRGVAKLSYKSGAITTLRDMLLKLDPLKFLTPTQVVEEFERYGNEITALPDEE